MICSSGGQTSITRHHEEGKRNSEVLQIISTPILIISYPASNRGRVGGLEFSWPYSQIIRQKENSWRAQSLNFSLPNHKNDFSFVSFSGTMNMNTWIFAHYVSGIICGMSISLPISLMPCPLMMTCPKGVATAEMSKTFPGTWPSRVYVYEY